MPKAAIVPEKHARPVSLKMLAEHLDLSPATVSFVLNNSPNRSIPETTRRRVREAAKQFGYQPSHIARALQGKRTMTIGVLLPELGAGYHSQVLNGAADVSMRDGYILAAEYYTPRLTTIRQPLLQMGSIAASLLLKKITGGKVPEISRIEPVLVVRESTANVRSGAHKAVRNKAL